MDARALAGLVDRLAGQLGEGRIERLVPVASHWPERAQRRVPATAPSTTSTWLARRPRPLRLLDQPRPIEALAAVPDGPPVALGRRGALHRVVAAAGPERLCPEWWREDVPGPHWVVRGEGWCMTGRGAMTGVTGGAGRRGAAVPLARAGMTASGAGAR